MFSYTKHMKVIDLAVQYKIILQKHIIFILQYLYTHHLFFFDKALEKE